MKKGICILLLLLLNAGIAFADNTSTVSNRVYVAGSTILLTSKVFTAIDPLDITLKGTNVEFNNINGAAIGANAIATILADAHDHTPVVSGFSGATTLTLPVPTVHTVTANNNGDVSTVSDVFSTVGSVKYNRISTSAIGANATMIYGNPNQPTPPPALLPAP